MSEHRYPTPILIGDYIRAIIGTILCGVPAVMIPPHPIATSLLVFLTVVFVVYGLRTVLRQKTLISSDETGLGVDGFKQWSLAWAEITSLRLAFFPTRRSKGDGLTELTLQAGDRRLKIDSNIEGFLDIAARAYGEARARDLDLSRATLRNFQILDISDENLGAGSGWGRPGEWLGRG